MKEAIIEIRGIGIVRSAKAASIPEPHAEQDVEGFTCS
jgi:hypothetical protein